MSGGALGLLVGGAVALLVWLRPRQLANVTTSETFDVMNVIGLTSYSDSIVRFANAIARAEGYFVSGSIPQRANNPGNLVIPGWPVDKTLGVERISVFPTIEEGWNRLYKQLQLIASGRSSVYTDLDMTLVQMGQKWAPGGANNVPGAWAYNVAQGLGVSTSTPLRALL